MRSKPVRPMLASLLKEPFDRPGFSRAALKQLGASMLALRAKHAAFDQAPPEHGVTWIEPRLVGEAAFSEWTRDGKLRQPIFLGIRHDKKPHDCTWADREG